MTDGIIQNTFKTFRLKHTLENGITTKKNINELEQELIAEIKRIFPLEESKHSTVYIRHYLLGDNQE